MQRVLGLMDTATARRLARPLTVVALLLYAATAALPFVHGTIRLLFVSASRSLTLLQFMRHLADKQPGAVTAMVALVIVVLPVALLLAALLAAWLPARALPGAAKAAIAWLRWRAWAATAVGITFMLGLRAAASATGGPQLKLLPGGWCFCAALLVASFALTMAAPARTRAPRAGGGAAAA